MSDDEITRLLRATLDAAVSYIFALEGQKEAVVVRARRAYEAALRALDEAEQLDVSPTMGGESEPIRRLRELGAEAADAATPTDNEVAVAFERVQSQTDDETLRRYLGVDPTSPTYDPDQYGTFTQSDGARNSPLGDTGPSAGGPGSHVAVASVSPADDQGVGTGNPDALDQTSEGDDDLTVAVDPSDQRGAGAATSGAPSGHSEVTDEQSGEDVQAGGLPGSAVAAEEVVAGDAPTDEGGPGEGRDAGAGTAPARGEVGPGVGDGEWVDL